MKKAFLVEVSAMTRVVVDVSEDWQNNPEDVEKIESAACDKLNTSLFPFVEENVLTMEEDLEMPYNSEEE